MTAIGPFSLGKPVASAVAYGLNGRPAHPRRIELPNGWEVVCDPAATTLVARTTKQLNREHAIESGYSAAQQALDILSANYHENLRLSDPAGNFTVLFADNDKRVLQINAEMDFSMGVSVQIAHIDADGRPIATEKKAPPHWHPTFRFYRLAESSDDVFDAYRNLFLAFEFLLSEIAPRKPNERERHWLLRALNVASEKVSLLPFVPNGHPEPNSYIVGTQYDDIRCHLFHAKADAGKLLLPQEEIDPEKVRRRYIDLARLWRHLAVAYLGLEGGGGVITYQGFKYQMDGVLRYAACSHSPDPTPSQNDDVSVSPKGMAVTRFAHNSYKSEIAPGIVGLMASTHPENSELVHRIGISLPSNEGETLFAIAYQRDGLTLRDIDRFEFYVSVVLINRGQPGNKF